MADHQIFLQNWIFTRFALPFLLVFFIIFAILEKTNVLGKDKKQLNALVSFIIGLIFVTVAYPTLVVNNLILFLTIGLVILFVVLVLWSFISGDEGFNLKDYKSFRTVLLIVVLVAVVAGVLWAFSVPLQGSGSSKGIIDFLFEQSWSASFWTNIIFVILIAVALAMILKNTVTSHK